MLKRDGFSYIETIIIIMIMLIMIHMMSSFSIDYKKLDEGEANEELLSVITYYQTLASAEDAAIIITFPLGEKFMNISSAKLGIQTRYYLRNGYFYAGNSKNATEIILTKNGVNHGATIHYYINEVRYQIIFQLVKGRVRIEKG